MITSFRNFTKSLFFKFLITIIICSFIGWGVADVLRSSGQPAVAKVGSNEIKISDLARALAPRIRSMQNILGESFNAQSIAEYGLHLRVLQEMISPLLLAEEAKSMQLRAGDKTLQKILAQEEAFAGEDGSFSYQKFRILLDRMNISEGEFYNQLRKEAAAQIINYSLNSPSNPHEYIADLIYKYNNEKIDFLYLEIKPEYIPKDNIPKATEEQLRGYYQKYKKRYLLPEYRQISYVIINLGETSTQGSNQEISTDKLEAYYNENKQEFAQQEKRDVWQMIFDDKEQAQDAYQLLEDGNDFSYTAKVTGVNPNEYNIGLVGKDELPQKMQEEIFSLQKEKYSNIISGPFGHHIFYINDILPEKTLSFEEAKSQIISKLTEEQPSDEENTIANIQDMIAAGNNIDEIATEFSKEIHQTDLITKNSQRIDGSIQDIWPSLEELAEPLKRRTKQEILQKAFELNLNQVDSIISDNNDYILVFSSSSIETERYQAFEEIQGAVLTSWEQNEHQKLLKQAADKFHNMLQEEGQAKSLKDISSSAEHLEYHQLSISREQNQTENSDIPAQVRENALRLPQDSYSKPIKSDYGSFFIVFVDDISDSNKEGENIINKQKIARQISSEYIDERYQLLIRHLYNKHSVEIDENAALRALN